MESITVISAMCLPEHVGGTVLIAIISNKPYSAISYDTIPEKKTYPLRLMYTHFDTVTIVTRIVMISTVTFATAAIFFTPPC